MINPFKYGCVVRGDYFCSRRLQEEELTRFIKSGQNVMIQGERRIGKTSLVQSLSESISDVSFMYVDLLGIKTIYDFSRKVAAALANMEEKRGFLSQVFHFLASLRPTLTMDPISGSTSLSVDIRSSSTMESMETLMDTIGKLGENHPCCVIFDEFQDLLNLDDSGSILAMLRGKMQFHTGISYIFLGSMRNKMSDLFTNSRQPFFKAAVIFDIGHIDDNDFIPFLKKRFESAGRTIDDATILRLLDLADRVSGDVQELCDALWATTEDGETVTVANLPKALELVFARESKAYIPLVTNLTKIQMRVLGEIARSGGHKVMGQEFMERTHLFNAASIRKSVLRLVEMDILYLHDDGDYRFTNPFLREWLKRQ